MRSTFAVLFILITRFVFSQSMGLALDGEEWNGVQEYRVKGRNGILIKQKLSFGEYKTLEVDRSWTKGTLVTTGITVGIPTDDFYKKIITTDIINKKQTLYFSLSDSSGNQSRAFCISHFQARDFNIGNSPVSSLNLLLDIIGKGGESTNTFFTKIYVGPLSESWELCIDNQAAQTNSKGYIGYLAKNKDEYYTIIPVSRIKNKKGKSGDMPFGSAGFEIRNQSGKPLAAVSLMDNGIIYLTEMDSKQRLLLSAVCVALLLQEVI